MNLFIPGDNLCGHILQENLGEGSYGQVWKALRLRDYRLLAVKILFPEHVQRRQHVSRFIQEFKILKKLRHKNIVEVYELLQDGGHLGMSMELVQGKPLSFAIEKRRQFPPAEAIGILQNILDALAYAHKEGVVHRDIKPENVLMTASADIKLTDFGIAKLQHSEKSVHTRTGFALGTPFYMAPEIILGLQNKMDHRIDIYAAGCVLYEMLTGKPPFYEALMLQDQNSDFFIRDAHIKLPPPDPRLLNAYVPDELAAICMKAMARDPNERFSNCHKFIAALKKTRKRMEQSKHEKKHFGFTWFGFARQKANRNMEKKH